MPTAWEDWPLGIASGRYRCGADQYRGDREAQESSILRLTGWTPAFSVKSTSDIVAVNGPADLAGRKVIVGSGTNQERILLGWNEDNRAAGRPQAQPVYLTMMPPAISISSPDGRISFGPQSVAAYKAALNGQTRVGWAESVGGDNHQKGNGLVYALQAPSTGDCPR